MPEMAREIRSALVLARIALLTSYHAFPTPSLQSIMSWSPAALRLDLEALAQTPTSSGAAEHARISMAEYVHHPSPRI